MCAPDAQRGYHYFIHDGERPMIEYDGNGTITARNTYGIGIDENESN
ncbi:MAG: hypothetical protein ABIR71_04530 [Chthoniobacterales bacterium]